MPKIMAGEYERHLLQITTAISDYLSRRSYPTTWPENLANYQIVVESYVYKFKFCDINVIVFLLFKKRRWPFDGISNRSIYSSCFMSWILASQFYN